MVTALFADIKDSMRLMEQLDPEDARAIVDPALKLMIDAVHRFDGYVVQSTGDGIFALFGAPIAHENHPQLGLYAAIWMQQEIKRYAQNLREDGMSPVEIRIGLNTGEAVMRPIRISDRDMEFAPIGQVAGLAERMQSLAPTGSIVVTDRVQRLTKGYFEFKDLGPARIKGLSEPINIYEALGHGPLRTRLDASAARGLSKFVGRQSELDHVARALDLAKAGRGQVVAAIGEAGMGKSRLFRELKNTAQAECLWLEVPSEPHGRTLSYMPVIELLKDFFEIVDQDDERQRREKVLAGLLALGRGSESSAPYLLALLGVSQADNIVTRMDEQIKRRRTLDAVSHLFLSKSLEQPLVVILEDLHRIDLETQALLDLLVDSIPAARILLLVNYRPEYQHQWGDRSCYSELRLDPMNQESANELLSAMLGDAAELEPVKRLIIDKTEGNPFFMEETVQILFEEGMLVRNGNVVASNPGEITIPPTVQAILAARIDRLPAPAKGLLQTLAVLGRRFQFELVRRVVPTTDDELRSMLLGLQQAKFLDEQPALPGFEYLFKHALTQEVAYKSLLVQQRRQLHETTGVALEAMFAERLEDHLAELAHHYSH
ncbi:MAG: ATP-binding protein, partial [Candidatus Binataceae bacterium]